MDESSIKILKIFHVMIEALIQLLTQQKNSLK